ncbi:[FeFe] hydrogenase, group A [Eubacterium barkeri]|uniref:[FeFe] hydrogenase, group A n=1 Tax=Eubacterium barkeri TaxID=1528 RepID=A0A1H3I773_EUBBA|nr:[FeFe] hydrogenase, group A [Eubacterium barkeri]SDY23305.1 [FeFe] hydrogenase, group A [Eubacterium barkeri]
MAERTLRCIPVDPGHPTIVKDEDKCVGCGNCLDMCMENVGVVTRYLREGAVGPYPCVGCGQCTTVCPEGALTVRSHVDAVKQAIADPDAIVVFSTSPAVRVGLGDAFGQKPGAFVEGQLVDALRQLGGDYVLDVTFAADLTVMEEGTEFLKRVVEGENLPQFTSCCPAWVRHAENHYPGILPLISTAKSPISMQGATIKTYFAEQMDISAERIVSVAVAPCAAKKAEINRPELRDAGEYLGDGILRDNDYVITTQELAQWMKAEEITFAALNPYVTYDRLLGRGSGGAVIFGNTGGVMEAALRMAYTALTGERAPEELLDYAPVRGLSQVKGAEVAIAGTVIRVAVVHGLDAADRMIEGGYYKAFHFIEVMTCPGGCISGAGQPNAMVIPVPESLRKARIASLYQNDGDVAMRYAMDNPEITKIYNAFYGKPLSAMAKQLLHTRYGGCVYGESPGGVEE